MLSADLGNWKYPKPHKISAGLHLKPVVELMKTIIPWLLVVAAAAGAVFFYNGNQAKTAELTKLQAQGQELETIRTEFEELKKNQVSPDELARLRESKDELLRLRNQVRQLTADKSQLSQQAQAAQSAAERAKAEAQAITQAQSQVVAKAQEQAQAATANACLNQLRQIDSAKQQWALEHQKTVQSVPTDKDLSPYLPGQVIPTCPGGGKYTLGPVASAPVCSIPGHVLRPAQ